jgi:Right handed beta helix region/Abnormal spindle-like microcephaly-assoc'd, ASPM-SPD-2-Hydin
MPTRTILSVWLIAIVVAFSLPAFAGNVIHVPADQPTIQAGINAASNGDTVLVSAGTYYEDINFNGKAITVTSASGPAATVIDGTNNDYVPAVTFSSGETLGSIISGFTIENRSGTGISISGASPTISGNILTLNSLTYACGSSAISAFGDSFGGSSPVIQGNLIAGNLSSSCGGSGGAILVEENSAVQIIGNVVSANNAPGISVYQSSGNVIISQNTVTQNKGSGIFVYSGYGPVTLIQNVITGNQGTGLSWYFPPITAVSNTIANNTAGCCGTIGSEINGNDVDSTVIFENNLIVATGSAPAFVCGYTNGAPTLMNNDVFSANSSAFGGACTDPTGTAGNISTDPLFVDLLGDDFHIQAASPAVKAGTTSAPNEPKTDMDGDPRIVGGNIDIGADEYAKNTLLQLSSRALHYAPEDVGNTSAPQVVTLTSKAKKAVALNLIATGANFFQTNNCGTSLAAGASCQISVRFSPLFGGTIEGALGIFTVATTNPLAVNLVGTGLAPQIQLPCCYYFYGQVIGTPGTQTGTLTNTGQAPLSITSIVLSGPTDFVESNNCPIAPNTLAVGASCTVTVVFTPTIVGSEYATIMFTDNAPQSPQTVNLSGSSVSAGVPTLNPTSLTFPTTLIGQSSQPQTTTLSNTGTGSMGIQNIYSYGDFPETNNCPSTLAVGASCTITVTYTPSYQGNEYGYVWVYTDSAYYQAQLNVNGTGQAPAPTISSLSLTSVPTGSSDTQITINGTGFVGNSTQVLWNGVALGCCAYVSGGTQISVYIPASDLATAGTYQISVFTPAPGGGTSNSLPFVVYQPVNYAVSSTKYSYRTITGTNLGLNYFGSAQITSPFQLQFGGGSYSNLTVGAGGTISFNGFSSEYNDVIPTTQTPMLVAPFWAFLAPYGTGNDNNVFWDVTGTAPNRELIIEWRDVPYCCSYSSANTIKFEVVFFEGSSNIQFNYADTIFGGSYSGNDNGATATSGVQVAPGIGTQFSYDQPALKSKTSLLWFPGSPTASVSTGNLSFGYHQIGSASRPQKVTLTNGGEVALNISSIAIDNGDFLQSNNCGTSLAPHKSCSIQIVFSPSAPIADTGTLTIIDNATNSPQTVALSGIGSVTPVLVYPILANFGNVPVGQTGTVPVVLANAANKPLSIQQIVASPSDYSQTNNCGTSLAPGASCTISVVFTPLQPGNVVGKLSTALNGKALTAQVKLVGSGQ